LTKFKDTIVTNCIETRRLIENAFMDPTEHIIDTNRNHTPRNSDQRVHLTRRDYQNEFDNESIEGEEEDDNEEYADPNVPIKVYNIHEEPDTTVQVDAQAGLDEFLTWAPEFLNDFAKDWSIDYLDGRQIGDIYIEYLTAPAQNIGLAYSGNNSIISFWNYYFAFPRWKPLAEVAKRLLVFAASEAAAERCFSLQRQTIGRDRYATKSDLALARVQATLLPHINKVKTDES
jgi:hypothetical protein